MYRTHNCGELKLSDKGKRVILSGWVHKSRDLGGMTFIDLRDRYGKTQLVFNMETDSGLCAEARALGREYVISAKALWRRGAIRTPRCLPAMWKLLLTS